MLTPQDVARLMADPSAEARAGTAAKLGDSLAGRSLTETERTMAIDIVRVLARDAAELVRRTLSEHVRMLPDLDHDLAMQLAQDVETVAVPMLQGSPVLSEQDLLSLVEGSGSGKQGAIAQRATVSEKLSEALVRHGDESVVAKLVSNDGAEIAEATFHNAIERFGESEQVQAGMVNRAKLPIGVTERLVTMVSEQLQAQLVARHELPPALASDLILQARERATLGLLSDRDRDEEVRELVAHLARNGRLSETLMLRAACMGDVRFVEASLAELAKIPWTNAQMLVHDPGRRGLEAICEKAGVPRRLMPVFRVAIDIADETEYDGGANDQARFGARMLERVLTKFEDIGRELDAGDVEYLLAKLDQFTQQAHRPVAA
jgi:uncharacterized protein (DUF2336 family)